MQTGNDAIIAPEDKQALIGPANKQRHKHHHHKSRLPSSSTIAIVNIYIEQL